MPSNQATETTWTVELTAVELNTIYWLCHAEKTEWDRNTTTGIHDDHRTTVGRLMQKVGEARL